jgi:hypothetical protein
LQEENSGNQNMKLQISKGRRLLAGGFHFRWLASAALLAVWWGTALNARAQSRIYYTDHLHSASMAGNGTDKRSATSGEPSYLLHGGQRWFLQFRSVAGTCPDGCGRDEVFAVSEDLTSAVQLTDDPNFAPDDFRWLKDDSAVSCSGVHFHSANPLDGDSHIVRVGVSDVGGVLAPTGPAIIVATAGVTMVSGPSLQSDIFSHDWAPGGNELVFDDRPGYNAGYSVFLIRRVNVTTGAVSLIFDGGVNPVYSPNGAEVAFQRTGYQATPGICAIRPNGSGLRIVVKDTQWIANYNPVWSPDGASIAFGRQSITQKQSTYTYAWDIFTAPSAGGNGSKFKNLTGDTADYVFLTGWR